MVAGFYDFAPDFCDGSLARDLRGGIPVLSPDMRKGVAEDTGLEPAGLLHLTRFPGELLSHSVNPPC